MSVAATDAHRGALSTAALFTIEAAGACEIDTKPAVLSFHSASSVKAKGADLVEDRQDGGLLAPLVEGRPIALERLSCESAPGLPSVSTNATKLILSSSWKVAYRRPVRLDRLELLEDGTQQLQVPLHLIALDPVADHHQMFSASPQSPGVIIERPPDLAIAITLATTFGAAPYMGPAYWIPAFWVPALLVTHYLTFVVLLKHWR